MPSNDNLILFADAGGTGLNAMIAAAVSAVVTISVNLYMNRTHNERMVFGLVQKIIEFAMMHPYLEDDAFCARWPDIDEEEKRQRYEYYCCHVFNTLERVFDLCRDGSTDATTLLYPDELIVRHRNWWRSDTANRDGYQASFQSYVNGILRKHEQGKP